MRFCSDGFSARHMNSHAKHASMVMFGMVLGFRFRVSAVESSFPYPWYRHRMLYSRHTHDPMSARTSEERCTRGLQEA